MTAEQSLDKLACLAKAGCKESKEKILNKYLPLINRYCQVNWYRVNNEGSLTAHLISKLEHAIRVFDENKGSFERLVTQSLNEGLRRFVKRRKYNRDDLRSISYQFSDSEDSLEETYKDVLANVEDDVVIKEIAALLAKGDRRKLAIINAWLDGLGNDSKLSLLLAQQFGGKPESHRQAIKRFRSECQVSLATIA